MARGALGTDPGRGRVRASGGRRQGNRGGGALAQDPKFTPAGDLAGLQAQQAKIQAEIQKRGGSAPGFQKRLDAVNAAMAGMQPAEEAAPPPVDQPTFDTVTNDSNQAMAGIFDQIQAQGPFNPGDYSQMRQQASDSVMNEFNRTMQPRFQQEEASFRQRMAEQGIPENSELYQRQFQDMKQAQNSAFQSAQNQAFQLGQSEQQQGWGQQFNAYQLPTQQLAAMSPFYNAQAQQGMQNTQNAWQGGQNQQAFEFQKQLEALRNKYAIRQIKAAPQGGGAAPGMSMDDRFALMDREFYNNLALQALNNGQGMPGGGAMNGFTQGIAAGGAAALGGGLR